MSVINMTGTGAGGIDPDELTALQKDVVKGKIAGVSGSDEPVEGTLELTGNTDESDVVSGKTFYSDNPYLRKTGSLSLTGNAQTGHVLAGETFYTNNCKTKLTGTMTVNSLLSFSVAAYSGRRVLAKWQNPNQAAGKPFSGVIIRYSTGGYPGVTGGTQIYKGAGNNTAAGGWSQTYLDMPALNTTYYFSCYPYVTIGGGGIIDGMIRNVTCKTYGVLNKTFTVSGTYTIPAGYTKMDLFTVGGGGGTGTGSKTGRSGNGGAGGFTKTILNIAVLAEQTLIVVVGAGSTGSYAKGGLSSITRNGGVLCSADGGSAGKNYYDSSSKGGSGAGTKGDEDSKETRGRGGNGGSDGRDGESVNGPISKGQGTTTKAWGSSTGTLYAGGGGGGSDNAGFPGGAGGTGGGGAGGTGISPVAYRRAGTANTGGGAGGHGFYDYSNEATGGSGIVLIKLY